MENKWYIYGINSDIIRYFVAKSLNSEGDIMEVRMELNDAVVKKLIKILGKKKPSEVVSDALALLSWASGEVKEGRVIVSADNETKEISTLVMPSLEFVKAEAEAEKE